MLRKLTPQQRLALYLVAGISARAACFATAFPAILQRRPELTSPLTSLRSLREGVFLYSKGSNPYDGGVFNHSTIYLALFSLLSPSLVLWILADVTGAIALQRIGGGAVYLLNPYTILTCLAQSTSTLDNALLLSAISARGHWVCGSLLALATHTSIYPALLLFPLLKGLTTRERVGIVAAFLVPVVAIAAANTAVFGHGWLQPWRTTLLVSDLTPNVGMWWYFFTEMFDHFRLFFLGVFQLHIAIFIIPICLRIADPLHATLVLLGVISTWKSYPTLADLGVWAGLLGCFPEITSNLRHPLFTLATYLHTFILLPLLHSLWLLTGTGNANFFYAATMVHGLNSALAVVDVVTAIMRSRLKQAVGWRDTYRAVQITGIE